MNQTEQIWKKYHAGLHDFIESRVGDTDATDDILQDVFVRIHSRIGTLEDSSKLQSWIYQITRNAIVDHYRVQKAEGELPESLSSPEADPSEKTRQEIQSWLEPMIRTLPEPYREAMILSEIQGLTQTEVARRQGVSLSGAKSRIQRGRVLLKKLLVDCCRFEFDHRGKVIDWEEGSECDGC